MEKMQHNFAQDQGILIGSSTVVSLKQHKEPRERPGMVHILVDNDAGQTYLGHEEKDHFVHLLVLHQPAEVDITYLANRIRKAVVSFVNDLNPDAGQLPEEQNQSALNLCRNIHLWTNSGEGTVLEPVYGPYLPPDCRHKNHVHILANLPVRYYSFIDRLVEVTEETLISQGVKLRPVQQFIHIHEKKFWSQRPKKDLFHF